MEKIELKNFQTKRPISKGAEKWLGKPVKCLDYGFVYLVDYLGSDDSIVQAARVSYGKGTKKTSEDRGLIRYLMRHEHTTPFEMIELKFHCKMPIFVARQWVRHRTASINEYSGRYSVMPNEFYMPEFKEIKGQSTWNHQARSDQNLDKNQTKRVIELLKTCYSTTATAYEEMIDIGFARELSRIGLSISNYTQWYWKIDLKNLFHFLKLRMDSRAQYEIQVFAKAMAKIVKDAFPIAFEAFEDYAIEGIKWSRLEMDILKKLKIKITPKQLEKLFTEVNMTNKREQSEFELKLKEWKILEQ
ncbi:MAG: thymidylate synthase, flavin-dependent [Candidatus Berkelbacteria bacterium Licking1014_85]|uniref:Flavin-dependent thymidylate synthase n=1 Tax=Candidatus Berkelbacteria bacterium Licking1014_85 TaxID=2017148 RepID=A0A554LKK9_9BACT|nr:MAG: thymidylate synthase, flavin-dependent [Candidatus Berkelbacteria bacterium Licking1014_85]